MKTAQLLLARLNLPRMGPPPSAPAKPSAHKHQTSAMIAWLAHVCPIIAGWFLGTNSTLSSASSACCEAK